MLVAVFSVNMAVGDFFGGGGAQGRYFAAKTQSLPGQWMVAIQMHFGAFDFDDVKHLLLSASTHTGDLAAHFDPRWKLAFGDGSYQTFVVFTKGIDSGQLQRGGKAYRLAVECRFDLGENVFVAAVQVRQTARIKRLALWAGDLVAEGDGAVLGNK